MKKKIAIVLYKFFPYGGLQKDFLAISAELLSRGHAIKVFTRSWEGTIPDGLDVIQIGEIGLSNHKKNSNFVLKVFDEINKYSPEIIFGFNKMPGLDLYFAADTCFAKHSQNKNVLQKYTKRFKQSLDYEKHVFSEESQCQILLLNNNQLDDFEIAYSTPSDRMTIIPPGIDGNWNKEKGHDLQELFDIPRKDKIILFVGSDFSRKGLDRAILGLKHLQMANIDSSLLVIGDDSKKTFLASIQDHSLERKIFFLGPRDDVASFMKSADLLVHPAREEAAGNIIIEAMVSGLPSLVSKEVGFSDEVKKFKAGVVLNDSFSQDEFNQLLEEIIEDENLSSIKSNITSLKNDDYFFSRSRFIADFIEERF